MTLYKHISKNTFFSTIRERLFKYAEVLSTDGWMYQSIGASIEANMQTLETYNSQDNFCGIGFWGYGINNICNGKDLYIIPDIREIEKDDNLNKHLQPYRGFLVLTFKIDGDFFYVSTFCIDSCKVGINLTINTKYDLEDFDTARLVTRNNKIIVEIIFKRVDKAISFQIDDYYHFPQSFNGGELAKFYIENIKDNAKKVVEKNAVRKNDKNGNLKSKNFISDFLLGIKKLQKVGTRKSFIKSIKNNGKKEEAPFRDWFDEWFDAKGYTTEVEPPKDDGRLDLRISHVTLADKIIEFKGWWNPKKKQILPQVHKYLTEFEKEGYIFMVNSNKGAIANKYDQVVSSPKMKMTKKFERIDIPDSDYCYYKSIHKIGGKEKIIYHFIFPVWQNGIR